MKGKSNENIMKILKKIKKDTQNLISIQNVLKI